MKRLLIAVAGGVCIPVFYTVIAITVNALLSESGNILTLWGGEEVPKWFLAPVSLPNYLFAFLRECESEILNLYLDNPWFRATFALLFDFVLYGLLTFAFLRKFGYLKGRI